MKDLREKQALEFNKNEIWHSIYWVVLYLGFGLSMVIFNQTYSMHLKLSLHAFKRLTKLESL